MKKSWKKSFDHSLSMVFLITIIMGLILFSGGLYTLHTRRHLPPPPQVSVATFSTTVRGVDVDQNRVTASLNVGFLFENTEKKGIIVDRITVSASQLIDHKDYLIIAKSDSPVEIIQDGGAEVGYQDDDYEEEEEEEGEEEEEDDYKNDTKWFSVENVTAEVKHWDVVGDVFYDVVDDSTGMHYGQESGVFYVDFALTCDVTYRSGNSIIPWLKRRIVGMEVGCEDLKIPFSSNGTTTMDDDGDGGDYGGLVFRRCSSNGEEVLEKVGDWLFIQGTFLLSISFVLFYCSVVIFLFKFFVFGIFINIRRDPPSPTMYSLF